MFNSLSKKEQAFILSRMIYRDTKIEDYHTDEAELGMEIYRNIINIVDENVKNVLQNHHIMLKIQNEEDAVVELSRMASSARDEFISYVIFFRHLAACKCNWDPPVKMEMLTKPKSLSAFILDGHFIECCKKHRVLSNSTMRYINKDIYNRIYTLMCENFLP